jgi:hypothetical protein
LEEALAAKSALTATIVAQAYVLEERDTATDSCLNMLDQFTTHCQAVILVDIHAQDFKQLIAELELRIGDLELIRIHEIRDEHDNRVLALESVVEVYKEWCSYIEGTLEDMRWELHRLKQSRDQSPLESNQKQPGIVISHARAHISTHPTTTTAVFIPPDGHRTATVARERGFGSVTTLVSSPNNGKNDAPPLQFN